MHIFAIMRKYWADLYIFVVKGAALKLKIGTSGGVITRRLKDQGF